MNDHQRGIYQPASDNAQVYDLADDDDDDEERSRLPLMIVVAFIVLAAFGGVVWLAYNQGVARGRAGSAVVINAPGGPVRTAPAEAGGGTPFTGLKIYSQPVPPDQEAQGSTVASAAPAAPPQPAAATEAPSVRLNPELGTRTPSPAVEAPKPAPPVPQPTPAQAPAPPPPAVAQASAPPSPAVAQATRAAPQPLPAAPPPAVRTAEASTPAAPQAPRQLQPAPPPPRATPSPTGTAATAGGAVLQIGAFESEALASGAWATFKTRHADVVGGLSEDIQRADLGARGTFYRLRVGPFTDRASAVAACEKLKAQRASCLVAVP